MLAVPLLCAGEAVGTLTLARAEPEPFTDPELALVQTFADQAVIAIENTRLFSELEDANRTLTEALEQQTATADILRVIASNPTELEPVLDAIASSAARLSGADHTVIMQRQGDSVIAVASWGRLPDRPTGSRVAWRGPLAPERPWPQGQAILDRRTIHVPDIAAQADVWYPAWTAQMARTGVRTFIAVPLVRGDDGIGVIIYRRTRVHPFTDNQIALLEAFADQAVIAIENARLFNELEERQQQLTSSVDQLTSLGEVIQTVTSTLNLDEVLERIVSHAARLSGSDSGAIFELDQSTDAYDLRATYQLHEEVVADIRAVPLLRNGASLVARAGASGQPVQIADTSAEPNVSPLRTVASRAGIQAALSIPLIREGQILGDRRVQVVAHHQHVEVLVEGVDRVRPRRVRRGRKHVGVAGDRDDVGRMTAARTLRVVRVDPPSGNGSNGVLDEASLIEVSVWMATWTPVSSATRRHASITAGVLPQSSCSLKPETPASSCSRSESAETVMPLPSKARLTGQPSKASSRRATYHELLVTVVAFVPSAGPVPPPIQVVTPDPIASGSWVGLIRWTWQPTAPAVRILPLPARISVEGPITKAGSTPSMVSGFPALPIPTMRPSRTPMSALTTPQ